MRNSRTITVDDHDENLYAAIARASARVGRTVGRVFDRRRARRVYRRRQTFAEDRGTGMQHIGFD
jgi:ribosome-associated translation inhibitor RaiA